MLIFNQSAFTIYNSPLFEACTFIQIKQPISSGVTGGGQGGQTEFPPRDFWLGKRQGKKVKGVKIEKKRRKIIKEKLANWKRKVKKLQNAERTLFFFFFFCLSLLKTTEICFGFWVYQNGNFLQGKKHFTLGKKSGKMTLPPQKNMPVTPMPIRGLP